MSESPGVPSHRWTFHFVLLLEISLWQSRRTGLSEAFATENRSGVLVLSRQRASCGLRRDVQRVWRVDGTEIVDYRASIIRLSHLPSSYFIWTWRAPAYSANLPHSGSGQLPSQTAFGEVITLSMHPRVGQVCFWFLPQGYGAQ